MTQNFIACDRDQVLLLPPSLREWLPVDHKARRALIDRVIAFARAGVQALEAERPG